MNKTREVRVDPNKKDKITKYSITTEEKDRFQTLQSGITLLNVFLDGTKMQLLQHASSIRIRLGIEEKDAPKGYERFLDFDPDTYEVLVIDRPILKDEPKQTIDTN